MPPIISLVHVGRDKALQDHRAEIVAEETTHRELTLLLVAENRLIQIGGIVTDPSHLPLAEAMAHRQINVDEIWITSKAGGGIAVRPQSDTAITEAYPLRSGDGCRR